MSGPPGVPLSSGFDYRPVEDFPELRLSDEARRKVLAKMDSVRDARNAAMVSAASYVVGGVS